MITQTACVLHIDWVVRKELLPRRLAAMGEVMHALTPEVPPACLVYQGNYALIPDFPLLGSEVKVPAPFNDTR